VAVFVGRALTLAGDVEDLSQLDMRPDLRPTRISIAIDGFAVGIRRRLIVALLKNTSAIR